MSSQNDVVIIERHPIVYTPQSTTTVNQERLPPPGDYRSMELNYRQDPLDTKELHERTARGIKVFLLALPAGVLALLLAAPLLFRLYRLIDSVEGGRIVAGVLGGIAVLAFGLFLLFVVSPRTRLLFTALAAAPITAAAAATLQPEYRLHIASLLFALGFYLLRSRHMTPSLGTFFRQWTLSDYRIDSNTRKDWLKNLAPAEGVRPNLLAAILLCAVPLFAALYSTLLSAGLALALCATFTGFIRGHRSLLYAARRVLAPYLSYDADRNSAPGVWAPTNSVDSRLLALVFPCSVVSTALALTLLPATYAENLSSAPIFALAATPVGALALLALYRDPIRAADEIRQRVESHLKSKKDRLWWECQVERLRSSRHVATDPIGKPVREARHLFLGYEPFQNFPLLLDEKILSEHCYMLGRTGSGKTSLGIMSTLLQIIRENSRDGAETERTPIVVLDLKGDFPLFHTLRAEAEARGQQFFFFTPEPGLESHLFNPFAGFDSKSRSLPQLVQLVLDSLSLNHGDGYGRSYYSQRSRYLLSLALQPPHNPHSFQELYKIVQKLASSNKQLYREAFELVATIETLTHYPQLVTTPEQEIASPDTVIQMQRALEQRQIVYFWLPAALESISVREIGKLVVFNLLTAAIDRYRCGTKRQVYLVIDEFQKLAGENLKGVLEQTRSLGISVILSNQSVNDLKTPTIDLRPAVRTNTRAKFYFSVTEPEEIRALSSISGEELQILDDERESLKPRLTVQDIAAIGDHPLRFLLHVSAGSGYTQFAGLPVPVQTQWPIPEDLYEQRDKHTPWPAKKELPPKTTVHTKDVHVQLEAKVKAARVKEAKSADLFIGELFDE